MYVGQREIPQKITPMLMFVGEQGGKAEEAIRLYTSVFHNSGVGDIMRYQKGAEPDQEGTIQHASFMLEDEAFAAMDSAWQHQFGFNEAVSFVVKCETQAEIDYFWERLSADPSAEQCGWLKDKYTVSWQIVPTVMDRMLADKDEARLARVTEAFLKMKKFEIEKLQQAYEGNS
jgi:predicted 3-demethylubiquinone-9 3-methyltransferase (glyoxalase superfamily)